jgi:uncharacterized protein (DUF302 family)
MIFGLNTKLHTSFEEAVEQTTRALADQGFGVLTTIDVKATLKQKLGEDMENYVILGACNPVLAHRALNVDRQIGQLLPCNVVVRTDPDARPKRFWWRQWTRSSWFGWSISRVCGTSPIRPPPS